MWQRFPVPLSPHGLPEQLLWGLKARSSQAVGCWLRTCPSLQARGQQCKADWAVFQCGCCSVLEFPQ